MTRFGGAATAEPTDPGGMKEHQGTPDEPRPGQDAPSPEPVDAHTASMRAQYARIAGTGLSLLDELMADEPARAAPKAGPAEGNRRPPGEAP